MLLVIILLLGVLFMACSNKDEEDGQRLDDLESMIEDVFNDDQTDLVDGITEGEISKLKEVIEDELDTEFNEENQERYEKLRGLGLTASDMFTMEERVNDLFEDGVLKYESDTDEVRTILNVLTAFKGNRGVFYERMKIQLDEALDQAETVAEARELVGALFEEGGLSDEASRELEEEALEKVNEILNDQRKDKLLERLEDVDAYLTKLEKEDEEKKKSIGDFAEYYKTDEEYPFLCKITQERFDCFVPESDIFSFAKIIEVKDNTGREVTITTESEETGEVRESTFTMSEDGKTVDTDPELHRLTKDEYEELGGDIILGDEE